MNIYMLVSILVFVVVYALLITEKVNKAAARHPGRLAST